jgi:hypothetical protein
VEGANFFKNKKVEGQSEIKRYFLIFAVRAKSLGGMPPAPTPLKSDYRLIPHDLTRFNLTPDSKSDLRE